MSAVVNVLLVICTVTGVIWWVGVIALAALLLAIRAAARRPPVDDAIDMLRRWSDEAADAEWERFDADEKRRGNG
jgi:hypothetical protein